MSLFPPFRTGVGIILVTISGAAWRITSPDSSQQCLGLGANGDLLSVGGRRPCSGRGNTPQGLLYPEFQHRPPPPSYQASMQEYRLRSVFVPGRSNRGSLKIVITLIRKQKLCFSPILTNAYCFRLLLLDRDRQNAANRAVVAPSPPPTYRSNSSTGNILR